MGSYAAIGITQALFTFAMGSAISCLTYFASAGLHKGAIRRIFYAVSDTQRSSQQSIQSCEKPEVDC